MTDKDYKFINTILKDINTGHTWNAPKSRVLTEIDKVSTHIGIPVGSDGVQGESNSYDLIYSIKDCDDIFLKISYVTDSYGYSDSISCIQFVKPVEKIVQGFEEIK